MAGVEYQVTKVDPTDPETKGMAYQVHKVSEEVAATLGGKVYRARIINDPTEPTVAGKVYQIVLIGDPDDPAVKGKVYNAILTGGSEAVVVGPAVSPLALDNAIADSLSYVKAFGGTEQRNLPLGYTQFGRIHFDGNCYFDTGVVINSLSATVKLIAAFDSQTSSSPRVMWGYMGSNANLPRWGVGLYADKWLTSPNATLPYGTADTDKHTFITELYDNGGTPYWGTYVDGALLGGVAIVSSETITGNTLSTYIGARNNNGTAGNYIKGNFTYLEITQNGVCLAKIYPCKRDSDNVLGLYNTVTNEFLPNLGTGTLTADIFASPTPDAPMDIVSNNGVLKRSKNLLDMATENIVLGKYINNSGVVTSSLTNFYNSKYIPVVGGETYTWSTSSSINYFSVMEYDSSKTFTNRTLFSDAGTSGSITLRSDTAFVLIGANMDGTDVTLDKVAAVDWQFERGSTASTFMPFGKVYADGTVETVKDSLNNTATAEMLLKVGDYQDVQEILSGAVTRNVGVKVLDGTENWIKSGNLFYVDIATDALEDTHSCYCTHFKGIATNASASYDNEIKVGSNATQTAFWARVQTYPVIGTYSNVTAFKQYLAAQYAAGTPVIVVYPLAESTTEVVAGQTLQVTAGDNVLEITQASLNNLELEAEYEKEA